jgi:uncharacterized phage-associated protein
MKGIESYSVAEKAVEAASVVLRKENGCRMSGQRLAKLLYIANRTALAELGRPILKCTVIALKNGPVHGDIHDLIHSDHRSADHWTTFIGKQGLRDVTLKQHPPMGKLSRAEVDILERVTDELANAEDWELVEMTRGFEEWRKNYSSDSDAPRMIPIDDIVRAATEPSNADAILQELREQEEYDRLFSS